MYYVGDFLGHESATITKVYTRDSTEANPRAIESTEQNIVPHSPYGKEQRVPYRRSLAAQSTLAT